MTCIRSVQKTETCLKCNSNFSVDKIRLGFLKCKGNSTVRSAICLPTCSFSEVLKRLDDTSRDVRLAAAHALTSWFQCFKDSDVKSSMENHIEFLYQELLVHLDDPDENTQNAILGKTSRLMYF